MWTTQKHVPRWDLPAGLAGAQLGVKTPLPIHEGALRHMTNRPDICLRDKKANTCLLIDISCPADGNVGMKHAEKLAKYGDLRVEVSRMWQCRTHVVPVVLGALGTVHAGIARWLDIIPGHHNLQHLQKAVLLGSARILRKVMSSSV